MSEDEITPALTLWQAHNVDTNGKPGPVMLWRFEEGVANKNKRYEQCGPLEWFTQADVTLIRNEADEEWPSDHERHIALSDLADRIQTFLPSSP